MRTHKLKTIITYVIALVWLINGFYCKVLLMVPRHLQIVSKILGDQHATTFTILIGFFEILIALWVLSRRQTKLNAIFQITIILVMNIVELIKAPELLLWGKLNIVFAILFCLFIYLHEFVLIQNLNKTTRNYV